jgi:hypothetical protein
VVGCRGPHSLQQIVGGRDESGSDRIIPLPHPHPYFFVGCGVQRSGYYTDAGTDADFFGCRDMVRSRIGCGADAD